MRHLRGGNIALIFQEPSASFNPYLKISTQMIETISLHRKVRKQRARGIAAGLLGAVGIAEPERRIDDFPHQFSGGMLQRVLVAMAVACEADVILADEPTSDLDLTSQDKVLDLLQSVSRRNGVSVLLVTHDLGVAARMCDAVSVMYAGRVVESAPVIEFFKDPKHPYSQDLLRISRTLNPGKAGPGIPGDPPDFHDLPSGCVYHPRCRYATGVCMQKSPPEIRFAGRSVRCRLYNNLS